MNDSPIYDQICAGAEYMLAKHAEVRAAGVTREDDGPSRPESIVPVDTLADAGHPVERVAVGFLCAVHRHRDYVPLNVHHIVPRGMGGPDVPANKVTLCMNAHGLVHEVIRRLMDHGGTIPDREHFGAKVVALAMRGWEGAGKPTKGGGE